MFKGTCLGERHFRSHTEVALLSVAWPGGYDTSGSSFEACRNRDVFKWDEEFTGVFWPLTMASKLGTQEALIGGYVAFRHDSNDYFCKLIPAQS